ncbi:lipopolysaccharide biosynthesis protein, partial [uncultured Fusobacterium sp.]|uniref:lipopolysaccharide biosynthesis protein n=1 Tax=uncultured Fusobacterium sp. TaxID=159267 RepID=UPI0034D7961E
IKYHSFFVYIILLTLDNLTQWIFFKFHYKKKYSFIVKTKEKFIGIKNDIKNLFWHKIGGLVVFNTDLILISKFTSLEIVGIYASYQMIISVLKTIVDILTNVLSPKIGNFIAKHTKIEIYDNFKKINIFYCFIATIFTYCMYILINSFVTLWLEKTMLLNNFTIGLICFNLWVNLFRGILDRFKEGAGFFDDIKAPILESIINLIVSIILGLKMGLDGVIIGTITSNIVVILIYKPVLVFERCFDKDWKEYIKVYRNYFILVTISLIILNFITKPFIQENINSWLEWIIYAIKISSISLVVITLIFLLNKDFRNLIQENIRIGRT